MHGLKRSPPARFAGQILRGVGQVMLQNNPWTGLLFLAGIFANSWVFGLYALLGTAVSTAVATAFGASGEDLGNGLFGFNGTLTALALALYLRPDPALPVYVIVAAAFSSLVMAALRGLPAFRGRELTAPFVLTSWLFIAAVVAFARLPAAPALAARHLAARHLAAGSAASAALRPGQWLTGILEGVGQVMFQQNLWTGVLFLLGLAANSPISCAAAAAGSAIALGVAAASGAGVTGMAHGLYGFNAVLTAIAITGLYFLLRRATLLLALLAVIVSTIAYGAMDVVLGPLGLPILTAPFVLITWLCLASAGPLAHLRNLSVAAPGTPEQNRARARHAAPAE